MSQKAGAVTGRGNGSSEETACEGVVSYVEQAVTKLMPLDRFARRVKIADDLFLLFLLSVIGDFHECPS